MPKVTVLMPVYNAKEDVFKIAIESILNQTFEDFEFLIINDGSTNNTEDVIKSYDDKRIRYVKNDENLKIISTLNKGIDISNGEYIARLDSDDYSYPTRLEKQVKYLDENQNIGLLGTLYEHIPNHKIPQTPTKPIDVKILLRYCYNAVLHSSVMYRKPLLDKYNLRYKTYCLNAEDYMLWSDLSRISDIANYPEVLTSYRFSPDGISQSNAKTQGMMIVVMILGNLINDFNCDKQYMSNIQMKFARQEVISLEEYKISMGFVNRIADILEQHISPEFKPKLDNFLRNIPNWFVKEYTKE